MKDNTKQITDYLLWLSMCASYQHRENIKKFRNDSDLLMDYLRKQIRKHKLNYVNFCKQNSETAKRTAHDVFELRKQAHDFDYYDLV